MRAGAPLDPRVPLLAPSKTREMAAASTSKSITHASHEPVGGVYPTPAVDGGEELFLDRHI